MEIHKQLLDQKANNVPNKPMTPKYITVHNTANTDNGANAKLHADYMTNGSEGRQASWHYTVDDSEIWQSLEDTQQGWHAGDESGRGNTESIGIEICENSDGNFDKAVANTQALIRRLMDDHTIPLNQVKTHNYWSGKNCPRQLLDDWGSFVDGIEDEDSNETGSIEQSKSSKPEPFTQDSDIPELENTGDNVRKVQQMLSDVGYELEVDGIFGEETDSTVREFQKAYGLAVDGQAGPVTQNKLKAELNSKKDQSNLTVDGSWGPATTRALQKRFGTAIDGVVSGQVQSTSIDNILSAKIGTSGSNLVRAMQNWLGIAQDGILGPQTITALQNKLETHPDGYISNPSLVVSEMQSRLNAGDL